MIKKEERDNFLELIQSNIQRHGYHVTIVTGGPEPRYAYTIGLRDQLGYELILAGTILYLKKDVLLILEIIVQKLIAGAAPIELNSQIDQLGYFELREVHDSWSKIMMLGVVDYYNTESFEVFQILPDSDHVTLDIPDMSRELNSKAEPVWHWLKSKWEFEVPDNINVVTNLDALRGEVITEVMRWEEDEWEMFAGPGPKVPKEEMRVVPLGCLIGIDNTILPALKLSVGKGMWRESLEDDWNDWG